MAAVLTEARTLTCGVAPQHGGKLAPAGSSKLKVGGKGVITKQALLAPGLTIATCPFKLPNGVAKPCTTISQPTAGVSTKLKVGGVFVVCDDLAAPVVENPGIFVQATSAPGQKLSAK